MHYTTLLPVFIGLAHGAALLEDRTVKPTACYADNVLRALRNPKVLAEASKFCSSYIHLPKVTVFATASTTTTLLVRLIILRCIQR